MRDVNAFRERFNRWKTTGELPYEAGLPKYAPGKDDASDMSRYKLAKDFISEYEGFVDHVYQKEGDVPTGGYGTTNKNWINKWRRAGKISQKEALLAMQEYIDSGRDVIRKYIPKYDNLPDSARMVIDDIYYNIGEGNLRKSPKFLAAINGGNWQEAIRQMDWDNNKPGFSNGARRRNAARQELFMRDIGNTPQPQRVSNVPTAVEMVEAAPKWRPVGYSVPSYGTDRPYYDQNIPQSINRANAKYPEYSFVPTYNTLLKTAVEMLNEAPLYKPTFQINL